MRLIDADDLEYDVLDSGASNEEDFIDLIRIAKTIEPKEVMDKMIPLKRCPFCGGEASFETKKMPLTMCVSVRCEICGCQTKLFNDYDDPNLETIDNKAFKRAARMWNKRKNFST